MMILESGYEFDSLPELPPLPQVYSTSYPYADSTTPLESLPPFPYSNFTTYGGDFTFSDQHGYSLDSSLSLLTHDSLTELTPFENLFPLDSSLPLLTRDFLTESTQLDKLFSLSTPFHHLPDLQSIEHTTTEPPCLSLAPVSTKHDNDMKRRRLKSTSSKSESPSSSSHGGSSRRRNLSDRIRSLEKLMPWEKKMSLAAILEESHKYITFLHSQIASLRWMPLDSLYPAKPGETGLVATTPLKSLTRQQILQVIANSPGSRNVLYTRRVCVFSYEQLLSVKMMADSTRNI